MAAAAGAVAGAAATGPTTGAAAPVVLSVGGERIVTSLATLEAAPEASFAAGLARAVRAQRAAEGSAGGSGAATGGAAGAAGGAPALALVVDEGNGGYFVDRDAALFRPVLQLLRTGAWRPELSGLEGSGSGSAAGALRDECEFWGVSPPADEHVSDTTLELAVQASREEEVDRFLAEDGVQEAIGLILGRLMEHARAGQAKFESVQVVVASESAEGEVPLFAVRLRPLVAQRVVARDAVCRVLALRYDVTTRWEEPSWDKKQAVLVWTHREARDKV